MLSLSTITSISNIVVALITSLIFIFGVIAFFRGGWKCIKDYNYFAKKATLFMDKMLPDILSHLEDTGRIPKSTLSKWTETSCACSPIAITPKGWELVKKYEVDKIFTEKKEEWLEIIKQKNPIDSLDLEKKCLDYLYDIIDKEIAFRPIREKMYQNPGELMPAVVASLLGIMLRDYCIEKKIIK
jgi:hypothetical protein